MPAWPGSRCGRRGAAGEPFGITPYGTETMHVLRAEKGYMIVGQETDGTVTPMDLGLDWMIARASATTSASARTGAPTRCGRTASSSSALLPSERLPEGAQLVHEEGRADGRAT